MKIMFFNAKVGRNEHQKRENPLRFRKEDTTCIPHELFVDTKKRNIFKAFIESSQSKEMELTQIVCTRMYMVENCSRITLGQVF